MKNTRNLFLKFFCPFSTKRMSFDGFFFPGVYGLIASSKRELFWKELGSIRGLWDGPCCVW